jgi:hypothetical protein
MLAMAEQKYLSGSPEGVAENRGGRAILTTPNTDQRCFWRYIETYPVE